MHKDVLQHFRKNDHVLFDVVQKVMPIHLTLVPNSFERLCDAIISQQLSTKAADTIFDRFKNLFPDRKIDPLFLLAIPDDLLKSVGISSAKTAYLKDLARHVMEKKLILEDLPNQDDETIIKTLTLVHGIGRWTVEMYLIFSLGREDIFSFGDLGLRRAMQRAYGFKNEPTLSQMQKISQIWSPYRTWASLALWKSLSLKEV